MRRLTFVLLLIASTACVQTNATMLNPTPTNRPPVPPEQVRIYRTAAQVVGRYEELALLNSTGESTWTNEQGMLESMRKKAGAIGANGLILDAVTEASAGAKVAGAVFGVGSERKGKAVAIFVFPDSVTRTP